MKRISLPVVVLLMIGAASYSMDISLGPKGTIGYSTFLGSDWVDYMAGWNRAFFVGAGFGAFATLGLAERFAIEPEALLMRLGAADKESGIGKESFISNYFSAAILLKARFNRLNLFAGPMVLKTMGSAKVKFVPEGGSSITTSLVANALTEALLAATAGIGYQFPLGSGHFLGELRGIYSLTRWFNQDVYIDNWRLLAAMVMIGYGFPIRKSSGLR